MSSSNAADTAQAFDERIPSTFSIMIVGISSSMATIAFLLYESTKSLTTALHGPLTHFLGSEILDVLWYDSSAGSS